MCEIGAKLYWETKLSWYLCTSVALLLHYSVSDEAESDVYCGLANSTVSCLANCEQSENPGFHKPRNARHSFALTCFTALSICFVVCRCCRFHRPFVTFGMSLPESKYQHIIPFLVTTSWLFCAFFGESKTITSKIRYRRSILFFIIPVLSGCVGLDYMSSALCA